jgi:proteasome accessory factor C
MAKRETGLARTARLLDLVPYLTTHQGVAISELAKTFGTTVKEITDDLNTLWMCGLPGYTPLELIDLEFESGFVSIRNAETLAAPRALDRAEALSIYMGLDLLEAELAEANSALRAEITNLQDQLRSQLISAPQVQIEANLASDERAIILRAIRRRGWIEITYHSAANDEVSTRKVAPYELSQSGSHEYLQGYCDNAKAIRNFRADRIVGVIEIDDQIWPTEQVGNGESSISYQVIVEAATRQVREVLPQLPIGSLSASMLGYSEIWIARAICSLAGQAQVAEPANVRALIQSRASSALHNYE